MRLQKLKIYQIQNFKKSEKPFEKKKLNLFSKFFTSFFFQKVKAFTKVTYLKY